MTPLTVRLEAGAADDKAVLADPRWYQAGPWLPPLGGALAGLAVGGLSSLWQDSPWGRLACAVLAGACAWLALRMAFERAALRLLENSIHRTREGLFESTRSHALGWTSAGRLVTEQDETTSALSLMFRTAEECQVRFLNERNRLRAVLESTPGALIGINDDLSVAIVNRHAEALFGSEPGHLAGRGLFDLLVPDEPGRHLLRDALLYKHEIRDREIRLDVQGSPRHFSLNLAFYTDDQDDVGSVMILQDVTEKRQLMQTVAMREKLVAMGQLAAGVAHELNTPLGNILGYAQLLRNGSADQATLAGYADIIATQSQRASRVVQDLLSYARKDSCQGESCELNTMVREIIDAFIHCRLQRYGIVAELQLQELPLWAEGSCGELDIVFTNIVTNAIHALADTPDPRITVSTWCEGSTAVIAIADNGPGVPEHARGRLFDPFFTTKEVGKGSGLGLFISQAMVTRRGGHIDLDTTHQPGARFVVRVPGIDLSRTRRAA